LTMGDYGERHQKRIKPSSYAHLPRGICRWTGVPAQGNETVCCAFRIASYALNRLSFLLTRLPGKPFEQSEPFNLLSQWFLQEAFLSAFCTGFRSLHGCGAAGDFHPSSSHPSVPAKKSSYTDGFYLNRLVILLSIWNWE